MQQFIVQFETKEEALAGAQGVELLNLIKQLHGLVFGYNVSTESEYYALRKKTDALIKSATGR